MEIINLERTDVEKNTQRLIGTSLSRGAKRVPFDEFGPPEIRLFLRQTAFGRVCERRRRARRCRSVDCDFGLYPK
jgi:hypothetical protein